MNQQYQNILAPVDGSKATDRSHLSPMAAATVPLVGPVLTVTVRTIPITSVPAFRPSTFVFNTASGR